MYVITETSAPLTSELAEALELDDELDPPRADVACDLKAKDSLYLLPVDADDRAYRPRIPLTWCYDPLDEVELALDTLNWRFVASFEATA